MFQKRNAANVAQKSRRFSQKDIELGLKKMNLTPPEHDSLKNEPNDLESLQNQSRVKNSKNLIVKMKKKEPEPNEEKQPSNPTLKCAAEPKTSNENATEKHGNEELKAKSERLLKESKERTNAITNMLSQRKIDPSEVWRTHHRESHLDLQSKTSFSIAVCETCLLGENGILNYWLGENASKKIKKCKNLKLTEKSYAYHRPLNLKIHDAKLSLTVSEHSIETVSLETIFFVEDRMQNVLSGSNIFVHSYNLKDFSNYSCGWKNCATNQSSISIKNKAISTFLICLVGERDDVDDQTTQMGIKRFEKTHGVKKIFYFQSLKNTNNDKTIQIKKKSKEILCEILTTHILDEVQNFCCLCTKCIALYDAARNKDIKTILDWKRKKYKSKYQKSKATPKDSIGKREKSADIFYSEKPKSSPLENTDSAEKECFLCTIFDIWCWEDSESFE